MKFLNTKKPRNYGLEAYQLEIEIRELKRKLRIAKEKHDSIKIFVENQYGEGFQFADDEGYLMKAEVRECARMDIDDAKVRAFYAKMGKKVPMKESTWTQLRVSYVTE